MNLVSYHLAPLRSMALVCERRSSADARDVYYSLDPEHLRALYAASGVALHPLLGETTGTPLALTAPPHLPVRVLFLFSQNSALSQMAEALLRQPGGLAVEVFSAGTEVSTVHPLAIAAMADLGLDISGQPSKHLDESRGESCNYIITVCDRVREECPVLPGDPVQIHWNFADPAAVTGDGAAQWQAFVETARQIAAMRVRHVLPVLARGVVHQTGAALTFLLLFGPAAGLGATVPSGTLWQSLLLEVLLTAALTFVITAVTANTRSVGSWPRWPSASPWRPTHCGAGPSAVHP